MPVFPISHRLIRKLELVRKKENLSVDEVAKDLSVKPQQYYDWMVRSVVEEEYIRKINLWIRGSKIRMWQRRIKTALTKREQIKVSFLFRRARRKQLKNRYIYKGFRILGLQGELLGSYSNHDRQIPEVLRRLDTERDAFQVVLSEKGDIIIQQTATVSEGFELKTVKRMVRKSKLDPWESEIITLLREGVTVSEVARRIKISPQGLDWFLKSRNILKMDPAKS